MAEKEKTFKKATKKADLFVDVQSKPSAQEEADKINGYLAQYWANKPKMDKMKQNITTLIQKFTIDHPEDSFRIQATFVNFAMIEDKKALYKVWKKQFPDTKPPQTTVVVDDKTKMKQLLGEKGFVEATWKKIKDGYFKHIAEKKEEEEEETTEE